MMQETPMILSEIEEINSLLYKPIISTQRIKYTCLNVSTNLIVLGSSSGSLYLFTREQCTFQQLIPLSEGPVSCVVISPDEKTIALATKRGSVCLVAVRPTVKLLAVSSEHLGELVTSLCWNDNSTEIYVGDGIGKISTMVLSIFTVNGIFQSPSCALMHLDSTIVQMHFSSSLLLISTMTRCYICDTTQEQFKQIGNKARDGEYGACFLKKSVERDKSPMRSAGSEEKKSSRKGSFNLISEANGETKEDHGTKIYCARPGCRLWEVTSNGIVVKTHQFKEALAIPPSTVYKLNLTKPSENRQIDQTWISQSINFSHLHVLCRKYLFSYTSSGLYIIDPTNAAVILWNNDYMNISMAGTIGDRIYLMTDSGTFHCLTLSSPESLILHLYEKKRYNECLRTCNVVRPELFKSIGANDQSHQIGELESTDNSATPQSNEITATLVSLISLIQSNLNAQPVKLNSGIVVVNAGNGKLRGEESRNFRTKNNSSIDAEANNFQTIKIIREDSVLITDIDPVICDNVIKKKGRSKVNGDENDSSIDAEGCTDLMSNVNLNDNYRESSEEKEEPEYRESCKEIDDVTSNIQTDLNPVYVLINNLKPSLMDSDTEEIILNIKKTLSDINENYGKIGELKDFLYEVLRATERHYFNVLLDNTTTELLDRTESDCVINEIVKAFVDMNLSSVTECTCGYAYPKEHLVEPKFLDVGRALLKRFSKNKENCIKLCKRVPFMWREYLPIYISRDSILDDILCVCLQTRDNIVLSMILPSLDVRQWEMVVKCLKDVESRICPSCGKRDENWNEKKLEIEWSGVTRELVKREGPSAAMTFLLLIETVIPNVSLDRSLFQSLIFTKILEHHGLKHAVEFDRNRPGSNEYEAMCSPKIQEQLVEALEKDLERPVDENIFGIGSHHWGMRFQSKSSTCPCCTLSLQTPVLLGNNGISLFPCGHAYHVSCLIQRKLTRCNLHT